MIYPTTTEQYAMSLIAYAVRIETAPIGSNNFLEETVPVEAADAEQAQDLAIAHVEARGDCHRHVLSVCRWYNGFIGHTCELYC